MPPAVVQVDLEQHQDFLFLLPWLIPLQLALVVLALLIMALDQLEVILFFLLLHQMVEDTVVVMPEQIVHG